VWREIYPICELEHENEFAALGESKITRSKQKTIGRYQQSANTNERVLLSQQPNKTSLSPPVG